MSVGGILQNSLSQPSYYLDMKLHRWGFISPGSHCLLMIIQVAGNLHAVMLLTIFTQFLPSPARHHLSGFFFCLPSTPPFFSLIPKMKILEVKFSGVYLYNLPPRPSPAPPQQNERVGGSGCKV